MEPAGKDLFKDVDFKGQEKILKMIDEKGINVASLEPVRIYIPFAHLLKFPVDSRKASRDHSKLLDLIEAGTALNQYQREHKILEFEGTRNEYVIAEVEDYAVARDLFINHAGKNYELITAEELQQTLDAFEKR